MSTGIRECVKGLSGNRNVEELLPEYISRSMGIHDSYARLKLMMEYYVFYEMESEGINPYMDSARDTAESLHHVIEALFSADVTLSAEEYGRMGETLAGLRQEVTKKMQVLTAYVDRFVVYEYILNRIQYRFEERERMPEDDAFVQETLQFIFSSQDNMAVNDNIRAVLGQLPMRMARRRYFDLVRESISVYKGSDVSSLEGFLYMFRTNAMLYQTADMDCYFTEFRPVLEELAGLDYEQLDGDLYRIYAEKIRVNASRLYDISDLYMLLQQLINAAYSIVLAAPFLEDAPEHAVEDTVIRGINDLFLGRNGDIWKSAGERVLREDTDKLDWLGEHFPAVEGKQEQVYDAMNMADAVLEETAQAQQERIDQMGYAETFRVLNMLQQLSSNSAFVTLEMNEKDGTVTAGQADEAAEKLIGELKELFQGQSRMVRRAVMANTLEKIPVFFSTPQEVAEYIRQSLSLCEDEAEKYASKQLIRAMSGD